VSQRRKAWRSDFCYGLPSGATNSPAVIRHVVSPLFDLVCRPLSVTSACRFRNNAALLWLRTKKRHESAGGSSGRLYVSPHGGIVQGWRYWRWHSCGRNAVNKCKSVTVCNRHASARLGRNSTPRPVCVFSTLRGADLGAVRRRSKSTCRAGWKLN